VKDNNDKLPKRPAPESTSNQASKKPRVPIIPVTRPPTKVKPTTTGATTAQTTTTTPTTIERKPSTSSLISQRPPRPINGVKLPLNTNSAGTTAATTVTTSNFSGPRIGGTTTRPYPAGRKVDTKVNNPSTTVGTSNLTVPVKPNRTGRTNPQVKPKPETKPDVKPPKNKPQVPANPEQKTKSNLTKTPSISEMHAEVIMTEATDQVSHSSASEPPLPLENNLTISSNTISPESFIHSETIPVETQEVESSTKMELENISNLTEEPVNEIRSFPSFQETSKEFSFDFESKPCRVIIENIEEKVNTSPTRVNEDKDYSNTTPPPEPVNTLMDVYSPCLLDPSEEINFKITTNIYNEEEQSSPEDSLVSKSSSPISSYPDPEKPESSILPLNTLPSNTDNVLLTTPKYPQESPKDYLMDHMYNEKPKEIPVIDNMDKESPKDSFTMDIQKGDDNTCNVSVNMEEYTLYSASPKPVFHNGIVNSPLLYPTDSNYYNLDFLLPSPVPRSPSKKMGKDIENMDPPNFDDI